MNKEEFEKLSVTELKAMAFDEVARLETAQRNLQVLNNRIAELTKQSTEESKE